jgi:hypothetical protein
MTHELRPGNPPPAPPRPAPPAARARARPPHGCPPRLGRAFAFALALPALALAACTHAPPSPPPAPHARFSPYRAGAGPVPLSPDATADQYADLFSFRDGGPPTPLGAPWPPGRSLRDHAFNPHRRAERGKPPIPPRALDPP